MTCTDLYDFQLFDAARLQGCNVSAVPLAWPPSCHQTGERLSLQPPATRPDQRTLQSPVLANLEEKLSDVPGTNFDLGLRDAQSSPPAPADM